MWNVSQKDLKTNMTFHFCWRLRNKSSSHETDILLYFLLKMQLFWDTSNCTLSPKTQKQRRLIFFFFLLSLTLLRLSYLCYPHAKQYNSNSMYLSLTRSRALSNYLRKYFCELGGTDVWVMLIYPHVLAQNNLRLYFICKPYASC